MPMTFQIVLYWLVDSFTMIGIERAKTETFYVPYPFS